MKYMLLKDFYDYIGLGEVSKAVKIYSDWLTAVTLKYPFPKYPLQGILLIKPFQKTILSITGSAKGSDFVSNL